MAAFLIIDIKVYNKELYQEYISKAKNIIKKYGGKYIAKSNNILPLSENWKPERIVIIKFDDAEKINQCFSSEEYQKIKHLRENSTESKAIIMKADD